MKRRHAFLSSLAVALASTQAAAFPGFFAYKGAKPANLSTHVILMKKDATTVVTVMPDYQGDLKPFAVVLPVPDDVKADQVKTLKRDFVERIDEITAPRFWEFWEMDPCDPAGQQQEWERDLSVHGGGFLGTDMNFAGDQPSAFKPGKEMSLAVDPDFKEGENVPSIASNADAANLEGWLKNKGYSAPEGTNAAVAPYVKDGMAFLVMEVDTKKMELLGGDRAVVSPIRYSTDKPVNIDSTLGLLNLGTMQELYVYVIHPEQRFEVKNYPNVYPPTNLEVDFKVKERMGEFYAGVHDLLLKKEPLGVLTEFAWNAKGCGQPCPGEPLLIHELLSLGGDVFENAVPKEERLPKPPDFTEEEEKAFKEIKDKKKKKEIEDMRKETARRKALLLRHHYVVSRFHHRYDKKTLPKDLEIGPADAIHGGVDIPQGDKATLPTDVKKSAENQFQVRYLSYHQSPAIPHCDKPERWRWGKAPRTYLGLRKIWVAQDMATRNRTSHKPADLVITPVPELQLAGHMDLAAGMAEVRSFGPQPSASAPVEGGSGAEKKAGCGCHVQGDGVPASTVVAVAAALAVAGTRRRRKDA
jgi:MYXO-CTERM domain-containing protein